MSSILGSAARRDVAGGGGGGSVGGSGGADVDSTLDGVSVFLFRLTITLKIKMLTKKNENE